VISSSQRPLNDKTQHTQQTIIHAAGGFRTDHRSVRAAVELRLRQRGHSDRQCNILPHVNCTVCCGVMGGEMGTAQTVL
jgi:hypothetical protein